MCEVAYVYVEIGLSGTWYFGVPYGTYGICSVPFHIGAQSNAYRVTRIFKRVRITGSEVHNVCNEVTVTPTMRSVRQRFTGN